MDACHAAASLPFLGAEEATKWKQSIEFVLLTIGARSRIALTPEEQQEQAVFLGRAENMAAHERRLEQAWKEDKRAVDFGEDDGDESKGEATPAGEALPEPTGAATTDGVGESTAQKETEEPPSRRNPRGARPPRGSFIQPK